MLERVGLGIKNDIATSLPSFQALSPKFPRFMKRKRSIVQKRSAGDNGLIVEIFVVLDPEAVNAYMDFFDEDEQKVIELALIVINGIQGPNSIGKLSTLLLD